MELQLITTENFGELPCNFYRNMNDEILLTREQIGNALEYPEPNKSIDKIHSRHKERFEDISTTVKLGAVDGKQRNVVVYNQRGIMEICRWSRQPKANEFMDWVWDIIERYRKNELGQYNNLAVTQTLVKSIENMNNMFSSLTETLDGINAKLAKIEKQFSQGKTINKNSAWKTKVFLKLNAIKDYINENTDTEITLSRTIALSLEELEDRYGISANDYLNVYMTETESRTEPYILDVLEYYTKSREKYMQTLDDVINQYRIFNPKKKCVKYLPA